MVIHNIENDTDTSLVECLHHLLELTNTRSRVIRIGRVRTIRNIIILRIIPPVVLILAQFRFVHRGIVIGRQQMNMSHSQLLQMIDTRSQSFGRKGSFFSHSQKLSLMLNTRCWRNGKITMMHLINYNIGKRLKWRTAVLSPALRIGSLHVNDGSTLTIHTNSLSINTRRISQPLIIDFYIKGIELTHQVLFYRSVPNTFFARFHTDSCVGMATFTSLIQHETYFVCCRCPYGKMCSFRSVLHLCQAARTYGIKFIGGIFVLHGCATGSRRHRYTDND